MRTSFIGSCTFRPKSLLGCSLAVCLAVLLAPSLARAELSGLGDISEPIEPLGYGVTGQPGMTSDLIVGQTDMGGIFIDVAFDPGPLISPSGIVGDGVGSYGALSMDGFPSDWLIGDTGTAVDSNVDLIIGNAGAGLIDLFDSAKVQVGDNSYNPTAIPTSSSPATVVAGTGMTVLGREATGFGQVTMTNLGSRLVTAGLIVADEGVGDIVVNSRAVLYSADAIIGNQDGSVGTVTLNDLGTRWTVGDSVTTATLIIGNGDSGATNARGTLNINNDAFVQTTGVVTVNETGQINFAGGTLKDISGSTIVNNGLIRGDGFINGSIDIGAIGELRNAAATANEREYLLVSGDVTNNGTIESLGGEMEFQAGVTNNLEIVARDAVMRFPGGLTNNGSFAVGGDTTIHGAIAGSGDLHVLSDSETLLVGDLTFSASSTLGLSVGDAPGTLDVIGTIDLASALLELDYSAGVASQEGDTYQILSSTEPIVGTFSNASDQVAADGRMWDILGYGTSTLFVTATSTLTASTPGDFDGDGDVDGFDFLAWQRGFGTSYNATHLDDWEANFGMAGSPVAAATGAVPEPTSLLLLAIGGVLLGGRLRSRGSRLDS